MNSLLDRGSKGVYGYGLRRAVLVCTCGVLFAFIGREIGRSMEFEGCGKLGTIHFSLKLLKLYGMNLFLISGIFICILSGHKKS